MTAATPIITLALKNAGVLGIGQTLQGENLADSLSTLNEMVVQWNMQRQVEVIPGVLPTFPDATSDVAFWTGKEATLVWNLAVFLRPIFGMEPDPEQSKIALAMLALLQANNKQQIPALHPGAPATAIQIVFLALRMAGRVTDSQGVSDASEDVSDAFASLVMMLAQWSKDRWLAPLETDGTSTLPVYGTVNDRLNIGPEYNEAMVANLACRIMLLAGQEPPAFLMEAGEGNASRHPQEQSAPTAAPWGAGHAAANHLSRAPRGRPAWRGRRCH